MFYNPEIGHNLPHDPFKAIVSPRPIGWISSFDKEKNVNLAPYSFFNAVADNPPMVMFSITGQKTNNIPLKDTLKNIVETKCFVVNVVSKDLLHQMNQTSGHYPKDIDEFISAKLEKSNCVNIDVPRVKKSPASLECILHKVLKLPGFSNNMVIGYNAAASAVDVSNEITLGDANISAFRCADQSIAALSDGRDKSEVEESPYGLEFINKLKPVKFTWDFRPEHMSDTKQGKSRVGFIAQDLQEAMPNNDNDVLDLVYEISENRLEAKYGNLIPVMAKAIQELSAEVKELKKQING